MDGVVKVFETEGNGEGGVVDAVDLERGVVWDGWGEQGAEVEGDAAGAGAEV